VDKDFRSYLGFQNSLNSEGFFSWLTVAGSVVISKDNSENYSLNLGDQIVLEIDGLEKSAVIGAIVDATEPVARRSLDGMLIADIATVQELAGREGSLDWIDVILPEGTETLGYPLPEGVTLQRSEAKQGVLEQMTSAFRMNLSALSLLALIVGLFLIYNSITFSVVQRRKLFGTLRCLGVTRAEIFRLVVLEAGLVGLIGALLGIGLGILLGRNTIQLVSQTINDIYFTTTVQDVRIPLESLMKGGLIGIFATILAAGFPALEAASIPPQTALSRSILESKSRLVVRLLAIAGLITIILGILIFQIPSSSLALGFLGTMIVVIGFAMLSAISMIGILRLFEPIVGRVWGFLGRLASRNLQKSLSRTAVAVAALMVAVAVTIGINLMIDSFRNTVAIWLRETLQGDVYIIAPSFVSSSSQTPIEPLVVQKVINWAGVERVDLLRTINIGTPSGYIILSGTSNPDIGQERVYLSRNLPMDEIWPAMKAGGILITETLARKMATNQQVSELILPTPVGEKSFPVLGVYHDYSSSEGGVMMALNIYRDIWQDDTVTAIGLRLKPGINADEITRDLTESLNVEQKILIRPNQELRADVMEVFDRTFAITSALRILATIVAFIGILSTLLLLQLEKQREVGILRALGLTGKQLWRLTMLETGLMGLSAGILALPTGFAITLILIRVLNLRSFGWSIQLLAKPEAFLQAIGLSILAALLAGIYPAYRLSRMMTSEAVRYE
jgi:putative ABC transport system permease protein